MGGALGVMRILMGPTFGALVNTFQKGYIWIRSKGFALLVTRTQILRMKNSSQMSRCP